MEFGDLPQDIHFNIMLRAQYDDILTLSGTSKKFANISRENIFWQQKVAADFAIDDKYYDEIDKFLGNWSKNYLFLRQSTMYQ